MTSPNTARPTLLDNAIELARLQHVGDQIAFDQQLVAINDQLDEYAYNINLSQTARESMGKALFKIVEVTVPEVPVVVPEPDAPTPRPIIVIPTPAPGRATRTRTPRASEPKNDLFLSDGEVLRGDMNQRAEEAEVIWPSEPKEEIIPEGSFGTEVLDEVKIVHASREQALHGDDIIVERPDLGLYGVFDGVGSHTDAATASRVARDSVETFFGRVAATMTEKEAKEQMKNAFDFARDEVWKAAGFNSTTAIVTKLEDINGKTHLVWGAAGDSRLFVCKANGTIESVSPEQCDDVERNRLTNAFGGNRGGDKDAFGTLILEKGDRVMLCSDGITGDWDEQRIPEAEFRAAFTESDVDKSAQAFLDASRKKDDKSVIVFEVN